MDALALEWHLLITVGHALTAMESLSARAADGIENRRGSVHGLLDEPG